MAHKIVKGLKEAIAHARVSNLTERPEVTDAMIQAACSAGYGVDTDADSNLYKLMKRAIAAALIARRIR